MTFHFEIFPGLKKGVGRRKGVSRCSRYGDEENTA